MEKLNRAPQKAVRILIAEPPGGRIQDIEARHRVEGMSKGALEAIIKSEKPHFADAAKIELERAFGSSK